MKANKLIEILNNYDPELDVLIEIDNRLWEVTGAEISKFYDPQDMEKENFEGKEKDTICLVVNY